MARSLPTGTLTFVFTDVAGSTHLLRELGAKQYAEVLTAHRRTVREVFGTHRGVEVDSQGDSFFFVFEDPHDAVAAAAKVQEDLASSAMHIRIGAHTGEPFATDEGYVGVDVHRAARIAAVASGGQVVLSGATRDLVPDVDVRDLGEHRLKDLDGAERIFQLGSVDFPPLASMGQAKPPAVTAWVRNLAELLEPEQPFGTAEIEELVNAERVDVAFLHWHDVDDNRQFLLLPADGTDVKLGRVSSAEVRLSWDEEVSREHAVLQPEDGRWFLIDNASRNGSFVNGERIHGRYRLHDRDRLSFGHTSVGYREPAHPDDPASTALARRVRPSMFVSEAQRDVLVALCRPLSDPACATPATDREIADELALDLASVETRLHELFGRFGLGDVPENEKRAQLAMKVLAAGVVSTDDF